jgi:hypothetical protein
MRPLQKCISDIRRLIQVSEYFIEVDGVLPNELDRLAQAYRSIIVKLESIHEPGKPDTLLTRLTSRLEAVEGSLLDKSGSGAVRLQALQDLSGALPKMNPRTQP